MKALLCDSESFQPFKRLVEGPLDAEALPLLERFVRGVVLHDQATLKPVIQCKMGKRGAITTSLVPPKIEGYGLFEEYSERSFVLPRPDGSPSLPSAGFRQYWLSRKSDEKLSAQYVTEDTLLGVCAESYWAGFAAGHLENGGSVLSSDSAALDLGRPNENLELLFSRLDADWQQYARDAERDGLGLLAPPVLGIVLTRSARRAAIPSVLKDLQNEWSEARKKVWTLLDALSTCSSLAEAVEVRKELNEASKLFSPQPSEFDTRPVRVLWDITAGIAAGAAIGLISGGRLTVGAVTGGVGQLARSMPSILRDFGPTLFGRGAFDLARRVRRGVSGIERDALARIVSEAEKQSLGL